MIKILCSLTKWLIGILFTYKACEFSFMAYMIYTGKMKGPIPTDILILGLIGLIVISIWMIAFLLKNPPRKCPICKSENVELDSVKEVDRWLGKTKVREKMASGKIRERYVQCTKVKRRYTYCCQNPNCQHTYSEVREEEK